MNMAKADKDEGKLISVASRAHTAVTVTAPPENPDKPGLSPADRSITLLGASHPMAKNGEMVNHNIDAKIFRAWHEEQKVANTPLAGLVYEVAPDYQGNDDPGSFGFQPALEVMSGDAAAGDGSTVTHAAPVTAPEMAATSDTPGEDTPRSEPDVLAVKRSQKSASGMISEELGKK
jgi:hypothetical protein